MLRLFTHLDRWDKPSRIIANVHGSVVVRMLRPGWGCQGQIYSRRGAEKILDSLRTVVAPFDYALYHDCHVSGLKVIEMRPGMVERAQVTSSIGVRHLAERPKTLRGRLDVNRVALAAQISRRGKFRPRLGQRGNSSRSCRSGVDAPAGH